MARIGMFMNLAATDPQVQPRKDAFLKGLGSLGGSVQFTYEHGAADGKYDDHAAKLVEQSPDLLFASCGPSFWALQRALKNANKSIPIVFSGMIDSINAGRLSAVGNPGVTGYVSYDSSLCVTWLSLLKKIVPTLKRVAVTRDSDRRAGMTQYYAIQSAALSFGLTVSPIEVGDADAGITAAIKAFAASPNGGMIVPAGTLTACRRKVIIDAANQNKLHTIYPNRMYVESGGLIAHGAITLELYESAAAYAAKILDGRDPTALPIVHNQKFETVVNGKTAKAVDVDLSVLQPEPVQVI